METSLTNALIRSGVIMGIALGLFWLAARFGARFVGRMEARDRTSGSRANTLWVVLRRLINVILVTTAALILFDVWGVSLTPFLAVGTVFAAALGFGAQTFVRDVIAGFFILAENQYHVGDTVTIADTTGTVADVQLRVTVLRDFEGNVHYVPNGQIEVTSNFGRLPLRLGEGLPDPMTVLTLDRLRRSRVPQIAFDGLMRRDLSRIKGAQVWEGVDLLQLDASPAMAIQADGEPLGMVDSAQVRWAPGALNVIGG